MALDPSIFLRGAALSIDAQNRTLDRFLQNKQFAEQMEMEKKKAEQKEEDIVRLAEQAAYKKAAGLQVTPEEDALAQGWDRIQSSKVAIDPTTGTPYNTRSRIFDDISASYQPGYSPDSSLVDPEIAKMRKRELPATVTPIIRQREDGNSPFPVGFQNGSPNDVSDIDGLPMTSLSPEQLNAMLPQGLQNVDQYGNPMDVVPTSAPNTSAPAPLPGVVKAQQMMADSGLANTPKGRMAQYQAGLDMEAKSVEQQNKAALDRKESLPKLKRNLAAIIDKTAIVDKAIDEALSLSGKYTTGVLGTVGKFVPGSSANDLSKTINTIKANIGFDTLQQMRDNSPTGGALGSVTENELELLQSTIRSLEQSQSTEQFRANLNKVKDHYAKSLSRIKAAYKQDYGIEYEGGESPSPSSGGAIGYQEYFKQ